MYVVGEYVFRANEGICRISEIGHPDFQNSKGERMYYILIPKGDTKTKIYIPTEPEPIGIRRLISKDEALKLIQDIQYISPINIVNEKQREQEYKQALRSNDPFQLAAIIKTLYTREQFRTTQGKKTTAMDKNYFQRAEKLLYSELATVLGIDEISIPDRIKAIFAGNNFFKDS